MIVTKTNGMYSEGWIAPDVGVYVFFHKLTMEFILAIRKQPNTLHFTRIRVLCDDFISLFEAGTNIGWAIRGKFLNILLQKPVVSDQLALDFSFSRERDEAHSVPFPQLINDIVQRFLDQPKLFACHASASVDNADQINVIVS